MIHDKKNLITRYSPGNKAVPKKASAETGKSEAAKDTFSLGGSSAAYKSFSATSMGAAAVAAGGALAGLSMGLAGTAGIAAMGGMIGGFMGAAMGQQLGGILAKNAEEVTKQQRSRNADGRFRAKSGSTHVDTLRETYGPNFAAGLPGNMPLQILRAATGMSLTKLVQNPDKIAEKKEELSTWEPPAPAPGGRTRNADGRIRQKRGDTHIDTLREKYGLDFAAQLPGNWPLAILRDATKKSLTQMVKNPESVNEALPKIVANATGLEEASDLKGHRQKLADTATALDNSPADADPREGKVSSKTYDMKDMVGDIDTGFYSVTGHRGMGTQRITHNPAEGGVVTAELQNKKLFGDKPLASDVKIAFHENSGEILSVQDNSKK